MTPFTNLKASDYGPAVRRLVWTVILVVLAAAAYLLAWLMYDGLAQGQLVPLWTATLLLVMMITTAAVVTLLDTATSSSMSESGALASFAMTVPLVPSVALIVTAILYVAYFPGDQAVLLGLGVTLTLWILSAVVARRLATADRVRPRIYNELHERYDQLHAQLRAIEPATLTSPIEQSAYEDANEHAKYIATALGIDGSRPDTRPSSGLRWVSASGYIDLWNRIHRAEEALILLMPPEAAIATSLYDEFRLRGSTIANREDLVARLQESRKNLEGELKKNAAPSGELRGERIKLREISEVINHFRNERWGALAHSRNRLHRTGIFTGIVAYALLSLILITNDRLVIRDFIIATVVFYLVGALTGLFGRMATESKNEQAVEDYGLTYARLLHTPTFSGLAAIGGVILIGMAITTLPGAAQPVDVRPESVFTLNDMTVTDLVIAAVFGLTPHLLINRLLGQAQQYKVDLRKSEASGSSQAA